MGRTSIIDFHNFNIKHYCLGKPTVAYGNILSFQNNPRRPFEPNIATNILTLKSLAGIGDDESENPATDSEIVRIGDDESGIGNAEKFDILQRFLEENRTNERLANFVKIFERNLNDIAEYHLRLQLKPNIDEKKKEAVAKVSISTQPLFFQRLFQKASTFCNNNFGKTFYLNVAIVENILVAEI